MKPAAARSLHRDALILDLHCDLLLTTTLLRWRWDKRHRPNPFPGSPLMGQVDLPRLREGGIDGMGLGVVTFPLSGPRAIDAMFDRLEDRLQRHSEEVVLATNTTEILQAKQEGRISCFAGLEGVHSLRGNLALIEGLRARGMVYTGLVHFTRNWAGTPMFGLGADKESGLTEAGRDLVLELEQNQVLIDVAHLNRAGVMEVCRMARTPVICSHTGCNAIHPSVRNLDDDQLAAIANTGGIIGVIFVTPFIGRGGIPQVVAHMDHIRKTVGADHCAVGTDWEGFAIYPRDLDSAEKLPGLTQGLLDAGWSPEEIRKAYGLNFLRVLSAVRGAPGGA